MGHAGSGGVSAPVLGIEPRPSLLGRPLWLGPELPRGALGSRGRGDGLCWTLSSERYSERKSPGSPGLTEAPSSRNPLEDAHGRAGGGHGNAADVSCSSGQRPGCCRGAGPARAWLGGRAGHVDRGGACAGRAGARRERVPRPEPRDPSEGRAEVAGPRRAALAAAMGSE